MLFFHPYRQTCSWPLAVYHLCEAKFMAEPSWGVGKDTMLMVALSGKALGKWKPGKRERAYQFLGGEALSSIRSMWEKHGRPRVPEFAEQEIKKLISLK